MTSTSYDADAYLQAKGIILDIMSKIRRRTPCPPFDPERYADFEIRTGYLGERVVDRAVITLRASGCAWARRGHGCTICGHLAGMATDDTVTPENLVTQFEFALRNIDFRSTPILCLYNGGSILNPDEIPAKVLNKILERLGRIDGLVKVVLESRAEYCDRTRLANCRKLLRDKSLVVAIGLESFSDPVRNLCFNKGMTRRQFERAARIVKAEAELRLYVLIKPPFLTEHETIEECTRTIHYAYELGVEEIHFEPATIQEHTLTYYLWKCGLYRQPWLWSIIDILRRVAPIRVYVSPFAHFPKPVTKPHNCHICTPQVVELLVREYNMTFDVGVFDRLSCSCHDTWRRELQRRDPRPLETRIIQAADMIRDFIAAEDEAGESLLPLEERGLQPPTGFPKRT